ncbi:TetR/AcrR family transcriptional regulator [Actinomycetospora termitidis]|uniref:TetR/AcrR family transcriptional regulator n=1 Tax=Actinomycetospora termitidis TaxID=3053470 RepID=A0ABT7M6C2_9PSEU|nr:TetR/AcrR family transcriptional regulator [Actinomycetospora sp. Odt1-22]MDL5156217.1 TetR/AcrR family transcriptional regulator [Actinomycetospora sp. Odt1-22]
MPRLSPETWSRRRRHVLVCAWGCFSRDGFHATSMDQVIEATGMSSSAVYRYFRSKDELIDATVEEAFADAETLFSTLLAEDPPPGPAHVVARLVEIVASRRDDEDYDLSRLAMQAWTESLRRPHLRHLVAEYYRTVEAQFATLARRWCDAGVVPSGSDPDALARVFTTLMPGLVVMENLVEHTAASELVAGLVALGRSAPHAVGPDMSA